MTANWAASTADMTKRDTSGPQDTPETLNVRLAAERARAELRKLAAPQVGDHVAHHRDMLDSRVIVAVQPEERRNGVWRGGSVQVRRLDDVAEGDASGESGCDEIWPLRHCAKLWPAGRIVR